MSSEQLHFTLTEAQKELFRLRFQAATEKLDAPSNLRKLRREIARIYTIQGERESAAARKSVAQAAVAQKPVTQKPVTQKSAAQKPVTQKTAAQTKS
jgi:large subunit ribosomal protein L29